MKYNITALVICSCIVVKAQVITDDYFSKLEIPREMTAVFVSDTLYIDTLILHDGAIFKLSNDQNYVAINKAFIGKDCELDASGENGAHGLHGKTENRKQGKHGEPGKMLTLLINFQELGSLYINSNGGHGGDGGNARGYNRRLMGAPTIHSRDGGNGGNGADGGHISIYYHSPYFTSVFNRPSKHSVYLSADPGKGGDFGFKDRWRRLGAKNGGLGSSGKRGTFLIKKIDNWVL